MHIGSSTSDFLMSSTLFSKYYKYRMAIISKGSIIEVLVVIVREEFDFMQCKEQLIPNTIYLSWSDFWSPFEEIKRSDIQHIYREKPLSLMSINSAELISRANMMRHYSPIESYMPVRRETSFSSKIMLIGGFNAKDYRSYDMLFKEKPSKLMIYNIDVVPYSKETELALKENIVLNPPICKTESTQIKDLALHLIHEEICNVIELIRDSGFHIKKVRNIGSITEESLASSASGVMDSINPSELELRDYREIRHELFSKKVCETLGLEYTISDKKLSSIGYKGKDDNKTPDMIKVDGNSLLVIEFAVTDSDSATVAMKKHEKYDNVLHEVGMQLNLMVDFKVYIYKVDKPEESILPCTQEQRDNILSSCEFLTMMNERVKTELKKKGTSFRAISGLDEEKDQKMRTCIEEINKLILKISKTVKKKTVMVERQFKESNSKIPKDEELRINEEDDYYQEVVKYSKEFNFEKELDELEDSLYDSYKKLEYNPKLLDIMNDCPVSTLEECKLIKSKVLETKTEARILGVPFPKLFKFLCLGYNGECNKAPIGMTDVRMRDNKLRDDTIFCDAINKIKDKETEFYEQGMGLDKSDIFIVDEIMDIMKKPSSKEFSDLMSEKFSESIVVNKMKHYYLLEAIYMHSRICINLSYLHGRRFALKGNDTSTSVYKNFKDLGVEICIRSGAQFSHEKQFRYKISSRKPAFTFMDNLHKLNKVSKLEHYESKWLTMSETDLKHGVTLFKKTISLISMYKDTYEENYGEGSFFEKKIHESKAIYGMVFALMENKKETSTALQFTRYVFHSMTALLSDRVGNFKDINKSPVRSLYDSYVRQKQMDWALTLMEMAPALNKSGLKAQTSTLTDYDSVIYPDLFDQSINVEFSWIMNDIYLGNLHDKDSGFRNFKQKPIMAKMADGEVKFNKEKHNLHSRGLGNLKDLIKEKDTHYHFNRAFVVMMGRMANKKMKESPDMAMVLNKALLSSIKGSMMMTSSLEAGPVKSVTIRHSKHVEKDFSFTTILSEVEALGSSSLWELANKEEELLAIFSLFPKNQIGGPREILIQSVKLRLVLKFFEELFRDLTSLHNKDTLTKGNQKYEIQSNNSNEFRTNAKMMLNKGMIPLSLTLNADASKWAPSMLMNMMLYFIEQLTLPKEFKDLTISLIRSMSCKIMFMPLDLVRKWKKKPYGVKDFEEFDPNLEWLRSQVKEHDYDSCAIFSGMGQGMLHYFSSFLHDCKDDLLDLLMNKDRFKIQGLVSNTTTLISSDDMTKMMHLYSRDTKNMEEYVRRFVFLYDTTNRLANIHTNWKKTAIHVMLKEFNSYFTMGKRAAMACIKDVYTAHDIIDHTEPEDAVKKVLSSFKRCLINGVFLTTLHEMCCLERDWFKEVYRLKNLIKPLCKEFAISEDKEHLLPYNLGFFPTSRRLIEVMFFGPEFLMFDEENTTELEDYYKGLYTAVDYEAVNYESQMKEHAESINGKWRLLLPTKLDKRVKEIQERHENKYSINWDLVKETSNKLCLCPNFSTLSQESFWAFSRDYFNGMYSRYAVSGSMYSHSLVRALGMATKTAKLYPPVSVIDSSNTDLVAKALKVNDVMSFVRFAISRKDCNSSFNMLTQYNRLVEISNAARKNFENRVSSTDNRHMKMRKFHYYSSSVSSMMSSEEFLDCLFSTEKDTSNRFLEVLRNVCESLGVEQNDLWREPVKTIMNKFKVNSYLSCFKLFLDYYLKQMRFVQISLVAHYPDTSETETNLTNLLLEKTNPSVLYTLSPLSAMDDDMKKFFTMLSVSDETPVMDQKTMEKYCSRFKNEGIKPRESSMSKGMKMMAMKQMLSKSKSGEKWSWINCVENTKVLFKRLDEGRFTYFYYTDFRVTSYIRMERVRDTNSPIEYSIYCNSMSDFLRSQVKMCMERDFSKYCKKMSTIKCKDHTCYTPDQKWGLYCFPDYSPWCNIRVNCRTDFWEVKLDVFLEHKAALNCPIDLKFTVDIAHCNTQLYLDALMEAEPDLYNDLSMLSRDTLSIGALYKLLSKRNWLPKKKMVMRDPNKILSKAEKIQMQKDSDMKSEVIDYMEHMSMFYMTSDQEKALVSFVEEIASSDSEEETNSMIENFKNTIDELDDSYIRRLIQNLEEDKSSLEVHLEDVPAECRLHLSRTIKTAVSRSFSYSIQVNDKIFSTKWNSTPPSKRKAWWGILCTSVKDVFQSTTQIMDLAFLRMVCSWVCYVVRVRTGISMPNSICCMTHRSNSVPMIYINEIHGMEQGVSEELDSMLQLMAEPQDDLSTWAPPTLNRFAMLEEVTEENKIKPLLQSETISLETIEIPKDWADDVWEADKAYENNEMAFKLKKEMEKNTRYEMGKKSSFKYKPNILRDFNYDRPSSSRMAAEADLQKEEEDKIHSAVKGSLMAMAIKKNSRIKPEKEKKTIFSSKPKDYSKKPDKK